MSRLGLGLVDRVAGVSYAPLSSAPLVVNMLCLHADEFVRKRFVIISHAVSVGICGAGLDS